MSGYDDAGKPNDPILAKLEPDEPYVILRGQDIAAPEALQVWVREVAVRHSRAGTYTEEVHEKLEAMTEIIRRMREWGTRKLPD